MQPLLVGRLPRGADSLLHFYRVVALDALVRQGIWFTRWFPNLAFGYGYPIFQYYPPLPHYMAEVLHVLGLSITAAVLIVFAIGAVLGATGVYRLTREWFGPEAAAIASVAYAFAPYTLFNIFERAALAEFMALAWVPWVLWWLHRTTIHQSWRAALLAGIGYAAILLCHKHHRHAGDAGVRGLCVARCILEPFSDFTRWTSKATATLALSRAGAWARPGAIGIFLAAGLPGARLHPP